MTPQPSQYSLSSPFFAGTIVTSIFAIVIILGGQIAAAGPTLPGLYWFMWLLDVAVQVGLVLVLQQGALEKYKVAFVSYTVILTGYYLGAAGWVAAGDAYTAIAVGAILRLIVNFLYLAVLGSAADTPLVQLALSQWPSSAATNQPAVAI